MPVHPQKQIKQLCAQQIKLFIQNIYLYKIKQIITVMTVQQHFKIINRWRINHKLGQ